EGRTEAAFEARSQSRSAAGTRTPLPSAPRPSHAAAKLGDAPLATEPAAPSEANVEMIQDLIRKLADELNAASPAAHAQEDSAPAAAFDPQAGRQESIAALETTAQPMRSANLGAGEGPGAPPGHSNMGLSSAGLSKPKPAAWRPPLAEPAAARFDGAT